MRQHLIVVLIRIPLTQIHFIFKECVSFDSRKTFIAKQKEACNSFSSIHGLQPLLSLFLSL